MELSIHFVVLRLIEEGADPLAKEFLLAKRSNDLKFRIDKWFKRVLAALFKRARFVVTTISNASLSPKYRRFNMLQNSLASSRQTLLLSLIHLRITSPSFSHASAIAAAH